MPNYTCPKCARVFKRKSGYDDHMSKKNDCAQNTALHTVVEGAVRAVQPKGEITKENLPAFFEDLHHLLWYRAGLNPERALDHMTFFFAYRLIEQQADTLNLPQECRWSYIASISNENDLFEAIKRGVQHFRKNKRSVTYPFFRPHEIQKADIVFEIVRHINRISLQTLHETDVLGDIFEYMLSRGMSTMADEGQYFTNRKLCKLAFKLAYDIKQTLRRADGSLCTFADWFCGTGGFPAEYIKGVQSHIPDIDWKKERTAIYCQDMNLSSVTTTLLNLLILTGVPFSNDTICNSNSFSDPITIGKDAPFPGVSIDYEFMNPPYGGDKGKGKDYKFAYARNVKGTDGKKVKKFFVNEEIQSIGIEDDDKVSAGVQLAMATLSSDGGVCCIVLPQGFFFGVTAKAVELRKKLAEEYKIHAVVDIASGAFVNTGTKTSMLVFQRGVGPTETVKFLDMSETILVEAPLDALREKNYCLNYKQYVPQETLTLEGFQNYTLKDVCEFKRGNTITKAELQGGPYPVIGGGTSPIGYHDKYNRPEHTILISQSGTAGYISKYPTPVWASDCFSVESKTPILTNAYLYHILKSIEPTIRSLKHGTAQPHVYPTTIEHLEIPIPSLEVQRQIIDTIDGWTSLAQHEEAGLKLLETQVMFYVREMGKGKTPTKLDEICEIKPGKSLTKDDLVDGDVTVVGGGVSPMGYHNVSNRDAYTVILAHIGNAGNVSRYPTKCWVTNNGFTIHPKGDLSNDTLYYLLKNMQTEIKGYAEGTAQPRLSPHAVLALTVQLPSTSDQEMLEPEFAEIRHKHEKIAHYKAKAHEAIQRLIPRAA